MPQVPINYLAVRGSGDSRLSFWSDLVWAAFWQKMGVTLRYEGILVMSYVLAHALIFASFYLGVEGIRAGVIAGFWNWLGFVALVTLGTILWENKTRKLWAFNNAYQLLGLMIMGIILALWK